MKEPQNQQQKDFIDLYVSGVSVKDACAEVGYMHVNVCYEILRKYKDYVLDCMAHQLMLAGPTAIVKMKDMLEEGAVAPGANTRMEAAKQILDRIGLIKKEKIEIEATQGGIFILPSKKEEDKPIE